MDRSESKTCELVILFHILRSLCFLKPDYFKTFPTTRKNHSYTHLLATVFANRCDSYQNTPEPLCVQKWNPMKRCHDRTLHATLHKKPMEMRATCCCWGGQRARECGRHSKIFLHSEQTAGRGSALSWAGLCGCGPGFVRSLSEATSEQRALCNVICTGQKGGFPHGFTRTTTEAHCRDGRSVM